LKSKIIDMAENIKDAEDRLLDSLFATPPMADAGFSARVVRTLRRRLWLRRLAVPVAVVVGGVIAFKPLASLVNLLSKVSLSIPEQLVSATSGSIPQAPIVMLGAVLLAACFLGIRMLEE